MSPRTTRLMATVALVASLLSLALSAYAAYRSHRSEELMRELSHALATVGTQPGTQPAAGVGANPLPMIAPPPGLDPDDE